MKTQVFAYKGALGVKTDLDKGKFLYDPYDKDRVGLCVSLDEIEITQEAIDLINSLPLDTRCYSPFAVYLDYISMIGFWSHFFTGEDIYLNRDCDLTELNKLTPTDIELPKEFIEAVEKFILNNPPPSIETEEENICSETSDMQVLVKWNSNWNSEIDVSGFIILTQEEWDYYLKTVTGNNCISFDIGYDKNMFYLEGKYLLEEITVTRLTDEEADVIIKTIGKSFGFTEFYTEAIELL